MKRSNLVPLLLAAALTGYPMSNSVAQAQSTPTASIATWKSFTPKTGGFAILMPGQPVERTQALNTPVGEINNYFYTSTLNGGKVNYTISYVDLPQSVSSMPPNLLLEAIASGLTGDERVKLLNEQAISLESYPGKEFKVESPNQSIVRHRAYLVKQRIYQIAVEVPAAQEKALTGDIDRFFNSFKLL